MSDVRRVLLLAHPVRTEAREVAGKLVDALTGQGIVVRLLPESLGLEMHADTVEHVTYMVVGALIVVFLIGEPAGLARLWQIGKQKLRVWPFPY